MAIDWPFPAPSPQPTYSEEVIDAAFEGSSFPPEERERIKRLLCERGVVVYVSIDFYGKHSIIFAAINSDIPATTEHRSVPQFKVYCLRGEALRSNQLNTEPPPSNRSGLSSKYALPGFMFVTPTEEDGKVLISCITHTKGGWMQLTFCF